MRIVVLVKEVPDTYGDRKLNLETGLADRAALRTFVPRVRQVSARTDLIQEGDVPGDVHLILDGYACRFLNPRLGGTS